MKYKRIFLIVLDSLGIGEAPDAADYNDLGANTLGHIIEKTNVYLPNLKDMGLYNLLGLSDDETIGYYTRGIPVSKGKDTMVGHYEIMGLKTNSPYQTFTNTGFPIALVNEIEKQIGKKVIGNKAASGTEIINELGLEHMETGSIIVYTSADSVLQVAAHEEIIPLDELYRICSIIRDITTKDEWRVGRIIARPFIGQPGNFTRTNNRHDYTLKPPAKTVLDYLKYNQFDVISIGKVNDIFAGEGISQIIKAPSNIEGINAILDSLNFQFNGLVFANLNDFDTKYGHRRDVVGDANALKEFDNIIPLIKERLNVDDLLIITADHGNDPVHKGTDHTREYTPVLIYSPSFIKGGRLNDLDSFASIGATIADNFRVKKPPIGISFLNELF